MFALTLKDQVKAIRRLPGLRDVALRFATLGSEAELQDQLVRATLERSCLSDPLPTDADGFAARVAAAKPRIMLIAQELLRLLDALLAERIALEKRLAGLKGFDSVAQDARAQLDALLVPGFIATVPWARLTHYPRYLKAVSVRLDKLRNNPERDADHQRNWQALSRNFERELQASRSLGVRDPFLDDFRWLLEELRVGLFAQELKTPVPVSVKRLERIWQSRPR